MKIYIFVIYCLHSSYCSYKENISVKFLKNFHQTVINFSYKQNITHLSNSYVNYGYLPANLADILLKYGIENLEISFAQSKWNKILWGPAFIDIPPGILIYTKFRLEPNEIQENEVGVEKRWHAVLNLLSGLFCTSVSTSASHYSINPSSLTSRVNARNSATKSFNPTEYATRLAILPHESMCTENFSPWKKMLPCKNQAGLIRLLHEVIWFSQPFVALKIVATSRKPNFGKETKASPKSTSTSITFDSTLVLLGRLDRQKLSLSDLNVNSLMRELYGRSLDQVCPLSESTTLNILDPKATSLDGIVLSIDLNAPRNVTSERKFLGHILNVSANESVDENRDTSSLSVDRFTTIYGRYKGRIVTRITGSNAGVYGGSIYGLSYLQIFPCHLSIFVHTLKVGGATHNGSRLVELNDYEIAYKPGKKGSRGGMAHRGRLDDKLDTLANSASFLSLTLNANNATYAWIEVQIDFKLKLLPWYEYPPDSNHGFYVPSGVLSVNRYANGHTSTQKLYDQPLLLILPTPDFSMPYNVLCLSCTLLALSYGSIFNLTSKIMCLKENRDTKGKLRKLGSLLCQKLCSLFKGSSLSVENSLDTTTQSSHGE